MRRVHGVAGLGVGEAEARSTSRVGRPLPVRPRPIRAGVSRASRAQIFPPPSSLMRRAPRRRRAAARARPRGKQHALRVRHPHALQPVLELGRALQAQHFAHVERIVKRGGLVVEHDVVGAGHAHDVGDARRAEQRQQHVHVVLVGLGMVGVADVAAIGTPISLPQKWSSSPARMICLPS